jgi:flagella basal body P-ring formation protein FlgA
MKTRIAVAALLVALFAAPALAQSSQAPTTPTTLGQTTLSQTASLRGNVLLSDDYLRLGDLFENAGPRADTIIAQAPAPGKRVTLEARWLGQVAQNFGVDWRPLSLSDRSVVERASRAVPVDQIELELMAALSGYGLPPNAQIELGTRHPMVIPAEAPGTIGVRDLYYDERQARFTATVEAPAGAPNAVRAKITGRVFTTISVPVPVRVIARGDIIGPNDIEMRSVRGEMAKRDIVMDENRLFGQAARISLQAGAPIQRQDVARPMVVTKGTLVTLAIRTRTMSLTAQGKALEDGSIGDTVRVTNTSSNRTVEGRVEGPNFVAIMPAGRLSAN